MIYANIATSLLRMIVVPEKESDIEATAPSEDESRTDRNVAEIPFTGSYHIDADGAFNANRYR